MPSLPIVVLLSPGLVLGESVEGLLGLRLGGLNDSGTEERERQVSELEKKRARARGRKGMTNLDDRGDELDEESRDLEERREEVVEEVDEKTLDVRSILILEVSEAERRKS